ncbi:alpha/beta fold hydrolase [Galactobacter valiniphilus]|uniref:alpha/beta fold hydrolase n=1 Tax=Galactobacter valiniphilus TaxID=2676122 RepID=UPI003734D4EB
MIPQLTTTLLTARSDGAAPDPTLPVLIVGPSLGTGVKALWGPAIAELAPYATVVGWDLPGHGSGAPAEAPFTLAELADGVLLAVDRLAEEGSLPANAARFHAGVSIGGATTLQLGHDHPGAFAGLIPICTASKIGTPQGWEKRAALVEQAGTPTQVVGSAQRWFAPGFIEAHTGIATDLLHTLQDADRFSYAHACRALAGFDLSGSLAAVTDPVLAINGEEDTVCPPSDAEFTAAHVADGMELSLPGVGHLAPAEDPEALSAAVVAFLLTTLAASGRANDASRPAPSGLNKGA